jgi:hypothetical protein
MQIALLASVPCVHLGSALAKFGDDATVAFGTDARSTFVNDQELQLIASGTPVMIYASRPEFGGPASLVKPGNVTVSAVFDRWRKADQYGRHPEGSLCRPPSTLDTGHADDAFGGFWEVSHLKILAQPVPFASMRTYSAKRPFQKFFKPEYPIVVYLLANQLL